MKKFFTIGCFLLTISTAAQKRMHRERTWAQPMAETVMNTWKDSFALDGKTSKWTYDMGVILKGFEGLWLNTGDVKYYNYIQQQMDFFVKDDGSIKTYKPDEYNIDHVNNGKLLLLLYRVTWANHFMPNMPCLPRRIQRLMILPTSSSGWNSMQEILKQGCFIMHGMKANK